MRYGPLFPYAGARPLQEYFLGANDLGSPDFGSGYNGPGSVPPAMPPGAIVAGFDNYFGGVEFMYCYFNGAVQPWAPVTIKPSSALVAGRFVFVASPVANAANQARPMGVAIALQAAGQYGWVAVSGLVPVLSTASVATDTPLGITGVGTLGASSAGKEIENLIGVLPATTTLNKNVLLTAGSAVVRCTGNNVIDGLFIGAAVSGTGIPAGAVVQSFDPDGIRFTMSAGPGVGGAVAPATVSGGVAMVATYNDGTNFYNVVQLNRPFCQGRIT